MTIGKTTKLSAVNTILSIVGEPPISSLSSTKNADAILSEQILDEVTREVQARGWHFNIVEDVVYSPDSTNTITVSDDVLRIDIEPVNNTSSGSNGKDLLLRGNKLYDRKNQTYTFTDSVKLTVVTLLPFTDLPETARNYVMIRAGRIFSDRMVGSEKHHSFTLRDEMQAFANLRESEMDANDFTIFDHAHTNRAVNRISVVDRIGH